MDYKQIMDEFLHKKGKYSHKMIDENNKEVCDLDTGECYTVRLKDGLIERVDNSMTVNKKIKVETVTGVKQLLKD